MPADLEQVLTQIRAKIGAAPASDPQGPMPNPPMGNPNLDDEDDHNVSDTEGAALTLEHLAFGRSRVDGSQSIPHFRSGRVSTISKQAPGHNYHLSRSGTAAGESPGLAALTGNGDYTSPQARKSITALGLPPATTDEERLARITALGESLSPADIFNICFKRSIIVLGAITRVLPSHERGELLVQAFLDKVDWLHRRELSPPEHRTLTGSVPRSYVPQPMP